MGLTNLLLNMVKRGASDLHLRVHCSPVYRIGGQLFRLNMKAPDEGQMEAMLKEIADAEHLKTYEENKEVQFSTVLPSGDRFRVSLYSQRGTPALAVRYLPDKIPEFDSLGLPEVARDLALRKSGLLLVTGPTGSGKSTVCAAILKYIHESIAANIVTVEDPIEFQLGDGKSIVAQREVGSDVRDFAQGARLGLQLDPDVMYIGEITDSETFEAAVRAAETGRFVLSTLQTLNAPETLRKCLAYAGGDPGQNRLMLQQVLIGSISLQLPPGKNKDRVLAAEVLVNKGAVSEHLEKFGEAGKLWSLMDEAYNQYGSQTFDMSLLRLYQDQKISYESAYRAANRPEDFSLKAKGIEGAADRSWNGV